MDGDVECGLALQCEEAVPGPRGSVVAISRRTTRSYRGQEAEGLGGGHFVFAIGREMQRGQSRAGQCGQAGWQLGWPRISDPFAELWCGVLASRARWLELSFGGGVPCPAVRVIDAPSAPSGGRRRNSTRDPQIFFGGDGERASKNEKKIGGNGGQGGTEHGRSPGQAGARERGNETCRRLRARAAHGASERLGCPASENWAGTPNS
jgi:hypothetical protein